MLRILVVVLTALLGAALADCVRQFSPKRYVATVTLQINDDSTASGNPREMKPVRPEAVLGVLRTDAILGPVAKALGEPGRIGEWRQAITVRAVRDTQLIQISARAGEPAVAADLANALAEEYRRFCIEAQRKEFEASQEILHGEILRKSEEVAARRAALASLRLQTGIMDLYPDSMETIQPLADAIKDLRLKIADQRARFEKLAALSDAEVIDEISRATDFGKSLDPTLSLLATSRQTVVDEIAKATAAGTLPDSFAMRFLLAQKTLLDQQLASLILPLRSRLATELRTNEAKLQAAEGMPVGPQPDAGQVEKYRESKKKYLEEKKLLEALIMKQARSDIERAMPRSPVVIWERAEPPAAPDSRPAVLLTVGVLLGLFVGLGLAFLPRPGITAGVVLVLLGAASFPRWAAAAPAPRVSVGGAVKAPQLLIYAADLSVLRVINAAGGFTEYADIKKVHLLRDGKVIVVNVMEIRKDPTKDIPLQPGDSIEVPQSFW